MSKILNHREMSKKCIVALLLSYVQLAIQWLIIALLQHSLLKLVQCNIYPQDLEVWRLDTICSVGYAVHKFIRCTQLCTQYRHKYTQYRYKYTQYRHKYTQYSTQQCHRRSSEAQQWSLSSTTLPSISPPWPIWSTMVYPLNRRQHLSNVQLWWNYNKRLIVCWCENNVPRKCHPN